MVAYTGAGWRVAKSIIALQTEIDTRWPGRQHQSDGTIGDAAHRARISQHNPDLEGIVRALDVTSDPNGPTGWETLNTIKDDPRIRYVIARNPADDLDYIYQDGKFERYTRMSHASHCHVSIVADDALADSMSPWGFFAPLIKPEIPTVPKGDPMIITLTDGNKASYTSDGCSFVSGGLDAPVLAALRAAKITEIKITTAQMVGNFGRVQADKP